MPPMLFMLCVGPGALAVQSNNCVVQVWVVMPHYTKSKAQSFERRKEGQGFRLSYYAACIILMVNNVVEQRVEINFCQR